MSGMKYSGIKSIGKIPYNWKIKKCKYITEFINGYAFDSDLMQSSGKYPIVRIGDIDGERISFDNCLYVDSNAGLDKYKIKKDDLLLAMSGATVGKTGYSQDDFEAYINQRVGIIRSLNNKFINYFLKTDYFHEYVNLMSVGSAQPNISSTCFGEFKISVPNTREQKLIADFLDEKVNTIDNIICELNSQIEILNKYKKQLISESVTEGLSKKNFKNSKISFIKKIPDNWEEVRTLNVLKMPITDGPHETPDLYDDGIPFVSAEAVSCGNGRIDFEHIRGYISEDYYRQCCKKYVPKLNDIYMIKSGATTGKVSIVDTDIIFTIWSPLAVFRANTNKILYKFLYYALNSEYYQMQVQTNWTYGTQQNIGMRTLEKLKIVLPPIVEQMEIVNYLDKKCSEIEEILNSKIKQKEQMEQYKKSVIYEYVTGKKRVEGAEELYG